MALVPAPELKADHCQLGCWSPRDPEAMIPRASPLSGSIIFLSRSLAFPFTFPFIAFSQLGKTAATYIPLSVSKGR
ncbi:hypothetical protein L249_8623 [Ophiocordyceps polyrhachis-furcata BCC 54312]|uniref:Uncharacterized protein n=1 Tax=Ophiocordyceps polyrhachis-furcata BCC 54312 TaxID=1330021 RepID=A0A367L6Y4_9HYPO|nr:hypothetical protein L249_8623 [Ophiocordyceps polyrhachis-furcata BCC 54312]